MAWRGVYGGGWSAERSEAREGGVGRNAASRVAVVLLRSPLRRLPLVVPFGVNPQGTGISFVFATATRGEHLRVLPLPPASQGGSATRNNQRARSSIAQASLRSAFGNDRRNPCQSEQVAKQVASAQWRALKYDPPLTPPASRRRACPRHRRACSRGCRSSAAPTGKPRDRNCAGPSRHTPRRALRSRHRQERRSQSTTS